VGRLRGILFDALPVLVSHRLFFRFWVIHLEILGRWLTSLHDAAQFLDSHRPFFRKWQLHFAIFDRWLTNFTICEGRSRIEAGREPSFLMGNGFLALTSRPAYGNIPFAVK